jgi:hypothetical protein
MQDMKMDAVEQKELAAMPEPPKDQYPYGLRITLNKETLDKMGIKTMPVVGAKFALEALAVVESVHASASKDGPDGGYRSCELQITHLGLDDDAGKEEDEPEDTLYQGAGEKK